MMGLSDSVYWTNAFLVGFINAFLLCVLVTISLCVNFGTVASLPKSDPGLIFLIVLAYAMGIILMALLISVLVKSGWILELLEMDKGEQLTKLSRQLWCLGIL